MTTFDRADVTLASFARIAPTAAGRSSMSSEIVPRRRYRVRTAQNTPGQSASTLSGISFAGVTDAPSSLQEFLAERNR